MAQNNNIIIQANSNFHHLAGEDLLSRTDAKFREYRSKWTEYPSRCFVGPFPLFIDIEVTSACNLKCPFCATTYRGSRIKHGSISAAMVHRVIDEGRDNGLYGVKFNIRGEPLIHPDIAAFVAYAKKAGLIDVYFNTNAMLLNERTASALIDAGLDRLSISFEGTTKSVYEKYRVGAQHETVLANIERIQELKKKLGVSHPKIRIQTVMVPEVEQDLEGYKRFWSERSDEVALLDYKEMKNKKKGMRYDWACPQIWQRMALWWDGTILPCNHDDDGLLALGNLADTSIKEAWDSAKLTELREKHKNGLAHEIPACDGCYLRDSEILKLMSEVKR